MPVRAQSFSAKSPCRQPPRRHQKRPALHVILLIGLLSSLSPPALAGQESDWPQFLGPAANGISPETGLLETWSATQGPPLLWSREIGTGYSAPSIRENQLVLHHRVANQEIVESFDAATGEPGWKYSYPSEFIDPYGYNNGPRSTPLLTTNRCYTFGAEGKLLCLDRASGKLLWERDTAKDWQIPPAFFGVGSTPILESGLLIIMIGGQPNSGVAALEPETGRTAWENVGKSNWHGLPKISWPGEPRVVWSESDKQASYATPVAATIHGQQHLLCLMRQGLVSLDPKSGRVNFSYWFRARLEESVNAANPLVVNDQILISAAYYRVGSVLLKVRPDGRAVEPVWRSTALEQHWSTPIFLDGHLYAFSGRNPPEARFRCVEFRTGQIKWDRDESWQHSREPAQTFGRGSAILADGKLIALGETGLLGLFRPSPERIEELARYPVPLLQYPCWAGPVLARKRLYLRSENQLVCFNLAKP